MKFYLFRSGYIDTEGFLTSQFDPNMKLWLDPEYEDLEPQIRAVMTSYYKDAFGEIHVKSSLVLFENERIEGADHTTLSLDTRSRESLTVVLCISDNEPEKEFIPLEYEGALVVFSKDKKQVTLKGTPLDINKTFKELILLSNNTKGNITIDDKLNPLLIKEFVLSEFFQVNRPPMFNEDNSMQIQLNNEKMPLINEPFEFQFDSDTFFDYDDNQTLTYEAKIYDPEGLDELKFDKRNHKLT